ncbi:tRNA (N6-isopentenyl adenosine(37)-C2)-methylthiotransferase MiaB [Blattabacterium cuenoti]|uniref:tRNA (N6-isopentenyl adenosine(37)-C2)-methylthiotransferase MiaB n=1 Tax=Blattabacterium cuenoti TaxID=1653831 RepID=UPI00163B69DE|nr:tRNA (N6-isopentenyl adenosine(37)-C2)-methylthiotransferase MiaB [Blattabacterium cuenoti]
MKIESKNIEKSSYIQKKSFYIKNYGCQMNLSDSDIITSILLKNGFYLSNNIKDANIILFNSCSIREKPEIILKNHIEELKYLKKNGVLFGVLGCFSKKFKDSLLKKSKIDFFIKPNSYKIIPNIIISLKKGKKDKIHYNNYHHQNNSSESYEDITPYRIKNKSITTFLSIIRGCNNMCTFCIVPFTRGRELSINPDYIIKECYKLYKKGYKEVVLLGQNVNSYKWNNNNKDQTINFANLLKIIAENFPKIRIRFTTSNPHDMSDDVLITISKYNNICKHIHLPVQSGSNKILKLMNRKYSRENYLFLIKKIRNIIPNCSISHDIMIGFCNENEKDHLDTISLMNKVKYNYGYMFSYSPRPGTYADKKLIDNVPKYIKKRRLKEIITLQKEHSLFRMNEFLGKNQEILIEGESKKNHEHWYGRNSQNLVVVFPKKKHLKIGELVLVNIIKYTSATLIGHII